MNHRLVISLSLAISLLAVSASTPPKPSNRFRIRSFFPLWEVHDSIVPGYVVMKTGDTVRTEIRLRDRGSHVPALKLQEEVTYKGAEGKWIDAETEDVKAFGYGQGELRRDWEQYPLYFKWGPRYNETRFYPTVVRGKASLFVVLIAQMTKDFKSDDKLARDKMKRDEYNRSHKVWDPGARMTEMVYNITSYYYLSLPGKNPAILQEESWKADMQKALEDCPTFVGELTQGTFAFEDIPLLVRKYNQLCTK